MSAAPPPGIYVPAVLFFTADEELDEPAIRAHVLRLAQVPPPLLSPARARW
jgi:4-hydroxy-2-oxoglutarate aldolase